MAHRTRFATALTALTAAFAGLTSAAAVAADAAPAAAPAAPAPSGHQTLPLTFPCQQTTCDGELWLPTGATRPPVIVMAHGFGALRTWGLPPFAERFTRAGFAVFLFDYRGFGKSGGQPRSVVDGPEHAKDWSSAVDFVRSRPEVDGKRLGIWGTSYSGGAVLKLASDRPDAVQAVSAQVPFVSGWSSSLNYPLKYHPLAAWYGLRDLLRSRDQEPVYVPIVSEHGFSALSCPECWTGYAKVAPPGSDNKVAARVFFSLPFYSPGAHAERITAPVLLIAADRDGLIPIDGVRKVVKKIRNVDYVEMKGADHFSPYTGPVFEDVVTRQTAFFKQHLMR